MQKNSPENSLPLPKNGKKIESISLNYDVNVLQVKIHLTP